MVDGYERVYRGLARVIAYYVHHHGQRARAPGGRHRGRHPDRGRRPVQPPRAEPDGPATGSTCPTTPTSVDRGRRRHRGRRAALGPPAARGAAHPDGPDRRCAGQGPAGRGRRLGRGGAARPAARGARRRRGPARGPAGPRAPARLRPRRTADRPLAAASRGRLARRVGGQDRARSGRCRGSTTGRNPPRRERAGGYSWPGAPAVSTSVRRSCGRRRAATPEWRWEVIGPAPAGPDPANLTWCGWSSEVWPRLCAADVVVTHAGQNALAEVAAARRPAVVVPQDRPHNEQHDHGRGPGTAPGSRCPCAAVARGRGLAGAAHEAARRGGSAWQRWSPGDGAARAAAVLDELAGVVRTAVVTITHGRDAHLHRQRIGLAADPPTCTSWSGWARRPGSAEVEGAHPHGRRRCRWTTPACPWPRPATPVAPAALATGAELLVSARRRLHPGARACCGGTSRPPPAPRLRRCCAARCTYLPPAPAGGYPAHRPRRARPAPPRPPGPARRRGVARRPVRRCSGRCRSPSPRPPGPRSADSARTTAATAARTPISPRRPRPGGHPVLGGRGRRVPPAPPARPGTPPRGSPRSSATRDLFHRRHRWWPMTGWLDELAASGAVEFDATRGLLRVTAPDPDSRAMACRPVRPGAATSW